MKISYSAILLICLICCSELATAQAIHFESSSGALAIPELVRTLWANKLRVSYEDAPTVVSGDLEEIVAPNGRKLLQVRDTPMKVAFNINSNAAPQANAQVLQKIFTDHGHESARGDLTVILDGDFMHVVPASSKGKSKQLEPFLPMLDTKVSVQSKQYFLQEYVMAVLSEVSKQRGIPIELATVPINVFNSTTLTEGASNESARAVLIRAFSLINGPRYAAGFNPLRLSWAMFYEPNAQMYFFNVSDVPAQDPPAPSGNQSQSGTQRKPGKGKPN